MEILRTVSPELQQVLFSFTVGGLGAFLLLLVMGVVYNMKMQLKNQEENKRASEEVDRLLAEMNSSEALSHMMKKHWLLCEEERGLNPSLQWERYQQVRDERIHVSRVIDVLTSSKVAVIFPNRRPTQRDSGAA